MLKLLKCCYYAKYVSTTYTISVRWATKPRWVPVAKTKKFYVHPDFNYEPLENEEIKRLYNNYRAHMKSVIEFIKELHKENESSEGVIAREEHEKQSLWEEAMKVNEEWNRKVAIEREQFQRENFEAQVRRVKDDMKAKDEERRLKQEKVDVAIKEQKELSLSFITPENIDEHVEKILNSPPYSYYYAIDIKGNVYDGLSRYPTRVIEENGEFRPISPSSSGDEKQTEKNN